MFFHFIYATIVLLCINKKALHLHSQNYFDKMETLPCAVPQSFCERMNTDSNNFYIFADENKDIGSMKNRKRSTLWILASIILFLAACGQRGQYNALFTQIDSLADVRPELADSLLQTLAPAMAESAEVDSMYYALLRLKTDDKLYLNITARRDLALRLVDYYEHHNKSLLPTALFYAGRVCADLGDAPQALEYYQKALDVKQGENMGSILHEQMGYIFYYQGFFTQALDHFKLSYQCRRASNDTIGSIYNLRDIANSYLQMQKLDSCEANLRKALSLVECIDNKELHANILSQLARLYNKKQMYVQARDIIMPLLENCTDSMNLSAYYSTAATAYSHLGNVDSTRMLCMKLMDVGNKYGRQFASKQLADISFSNHNVADALRYTKLYEQLTDSIHKADNAKAVTQMDAMYNYQLRQKEADSLRIDNERKQKVIYMALAAFLILALFTTFIVLYNRYKRMKIQMWIQRLQNQNQQNERTIQSHRRQMEEYLDNIRQLDENRKQLSEELTVLRQEKEAIHSQLEYQYNQKIQEIDQEKSLLEKQLQETKYELENAENKAIIEKEKNILAEKAIRNTTIFKQIQSKIQKRDSLSSMPMIKSEWDELEDTVNNLFHDVMKRLTSHVSLNETERRITLLILLELQHRDIAELVCVSPSAESVARKRLYKKVTNTDGTAHDWDTFLKEFKSAHE